MGAFFHHLFRALSGYVQKWTKQSIPAECSVLHDFGDGEGSVPAAPVDSTGVANHIVYAKSDYKFYQGNTDNAGIKNAIIHAKQGFFYYLGNADNTGIKNELVQCKQVYHFNSVTPDSAGIKNSIVNIQQL